MKKVVWLLLLLPLITRAQERKQAVLAKDVRDSLQAAKADSLSVPQVDLYDVARRKFGKKILASGKNDTNFVHPVISVIPAAGYTLTTRVAFTISGNMAFRFAPGLKASTITASAAYTQNKQFTVPIESNLWLHHDLYNLVGDYRLYKYPQSTFGLGTDTWIGNEDPMDYQYYRFYEVLMRRIIPDLYFGAGYIIDLHENIKDEEGIKNFPLDSLSSYLLYGGGKRSISSGITINALYDHRDYSINPTRGWYFNFQYRSSIIALGSTTNWHSVIVDLRKYFRFPEQSRNILALWSYNWLVVKGNPPYLDLPSTSWDPFSSTGRGYIQGRFRGAQMVYQEAEYRFAITANGLFGGVIFVNGQTFSAAQGTPLEKLQPGIGLGLRVKLNKVSGTNVCIDYGFGTQGSKGLFINIGELF
ncbi:MAG TPA: BamA/TamA family outer membrane protein [Puia sp.]|nr:BamA/TamA family outer membrane protein [Puia sp.]